MKKIIWYGLALLIIASVVSHLMYKPPEIPELPVDVSYRNSEIGQGYVAILQNKSDRYLAVKISLYNATRNESKTLDLDLPSHKDVEIGWLEGWKFVSSDSIKIYHPEYTEKIVRIP